MIKLGPVPLEGHTARTRYMRGGLTPNVQLFGSYITMKTACVQYRTKRPVLRRARFPKLFEHKTP